MMARWAEAERERAARALCRRAGNPEDSMIEGVPMWRRHLDAADDARRRARSPAWRIVLGFAVAPGAASLAMAALLSLSTARVAGPPQGPALAYGLALFGANPAAPAAGVPLYLLARRYGTLTLATCCLCGAATAQAPWWFVALHASDPLRAAANAKAMSFLALFGGVVFWMVAAAGSGIKGRDQDRFG